MLDQQGGHAPLGFARMTTTTYLQTTNLGNSNSDMELPCLFGYTFIYHTIIHKAIWELTFCFYQCRSWESSLIQWGMSFDQCKLWTGSFCRGYRKRHTETWSITQLHLLQFISCGNVRSSCASEVAVWLILARFCSYVAGSISIPKWILVWSILFPPESSTLSPHFMHRKITPGFVSVKNTKMYEFWNSDTRWEYSED